jgi:hypothetical protein
MSIGQHNAVPYRLALKRSSYRQLWDGSGYPTRPNAAAVSGIVVHEAAESVMKKFAQAGVNSLMHPAAMTTLKELAASQKSWTKLWLNSLQDRATIPASSNFAKTFSAVRG